jgi:hypothetical protein
MDDETNTQQARIGHNHTDTFVDTNVLIKRKVPAWTKMAWGLSCNVLSSGGIFQ